MIPPSFLTWLNRRRIARNKEITQVSLLQLHSLSVTIHGRLMLKDVCMDLDNGLPLEIRRIYWNILQSAPISEWAEWN